MLKIKDNVDLKELEKFGFNYNIEDDSYDNVISCYEILEIDNKTKQIKLFINDEYWMCHTENNTFDLLYDLIKADLVEKVR